MQLRNMCSTGHCTVPSNSEWGPWLKTEGSDIVTPWLPLVCLLFLLFFVLLFLNNPIRGCFLMGICQQFRHSLLTHLATCPGAFGEWQKRSEGRAVMGQLMEG